MIILKKYLLIIGVIALLINLIITLPAKITLNWFDRQNITIGVVEGTIWDGVAKNLSITNFYIEELRWNINPIEILKGSLSYNIEAIPLSGSLKAKFNVKLNGAINMSKIIASLPLNLFSNITGMPGLQGNVDLNFEKLKIINGLPHIADGIMSVNGLKIPLVGNELLGNYDIEFFTQEDNISANIFDKNGIVNLTGTLKINNNRSFEFLGIVSSNLKTPSSIRQQLLFLPPADNQGSQELRLEGIL